MYLQGLWTDKNGGTKQFIIEADSWDVALKLENMYIDQGFTLQTINSLDIAIVKGDLNGPAFFVAYDDGKGGTGREYMFADSFKTAYRIADSVYGSAVKGITKTNWDFKNEKPI